MSDEPREQRLRRLKMRANRRGIKEMDIILGRYAGVRLAHLDMSALDLFDAASPLHDVLGPEFCRVYGIVKRAEYEEFLQVISPWEREHLLLNV